MVSVVNEEKLAFLLCVDLIDFVPCSYCIVYTVACVVKNSSDYRMLLFGRICGGISTSLLYSTFETWAVSEHRRLGLPEHLLGKLFGDATAMNAGMAIVGGLAAHVLVEFWGHPVAAFNGACVPLFICACAIGHFWKENFGDVEVQVHESFVIALRYMSRDLSLCGERRR